MFEYAHTILQDPVSVAPWAPHAFEAGELRLQQEGQNHSTVVALHTRPQRLQHTHYSHISVLLSIQQFSVMTTRITGEPLDL